MFNSKRLNERKEGINILKNIETEKNKVLIIHYSCESFFNTHGRTPRITSICVRNLNVAQTKSFSIHLQAQFSKIDFMNIDQDQYDTLEKQMLDEFFQFLKNHSTWKWVHWNMRDSNYGFEAINNRYRILGGEVIEIDDDLKYDFPNILGKIYTYGYEKNNPKGRLLNLAERNGVGIKDALTGKDEADFFENKKYLELHVSTLRKVDIINTLIERTIYGNLKVNVIKKDQYGLSFLGIVEIIKDTPILFMIFSFIFFVLGAAYEPVIQKIFGTGN